jgi:hypothetical protein
VSRWIWPILFVAACVPRSVERAIVEGARTDKFVKPASTWLCPTAAQAAAGAPCDGGVEVRNNREVKVLGPGPKDGVWPTVTWDERGAERRLFVAASTLIDAPDTLELEAYALDVARRYPADTHIPLEIVNVEDLIKQRAANMGRVIVMRERLHDMTDLTFEDGVFGFTLPFPVIAGSRTTARVRFEVASPSLVDDFAHDSHGYVCGHEYCDEFVFVAELTRRTVAGVDEHGGALRLPILAIRELGDRYGTYTPAAR